MTRRRSLKTRLTIPLMVAALLLGAATYWLVEGRIADRLEAQFDAGLAARADTLRNLVEFEDAEPEEGREQPGVTFEFEPEFMPEYGASDEPDEDEDAEYAEADEEADDDEERDEIAGEDDGERRLAYFQLWENHRVLARSASLGDSDLPGPELAGAQTMVRDVRLPDGSSGRLLAQRFTPRLDDDWGDGIARRSENFRAEHPELTLPTMTLAVAASRDQLDDTLAFVALALGGGLLAMVVTMIVLVAGLTGRGLAPLKRLNRALAGIDSKHLDTRLDAADLPEEIAPVADTVNDLLGRLEQAFEKERLFSRNVAHELRTPIAELRSLGEVGARWPDDPEANADFFRDIESISNRMDLMVTNLLMMARQENGHGSMPERLDLVALLRKGSRRFAGTAADPEVPVRFRGPEDLEVRADRIYLDIVASNLFSNAVHHGGQENTIEVVVEASNGQAAFSVENAANGLSAGDLPRLFDRFWRKDQARTAGKHVGLGLPLVKSLAKSCGWQVDVALTADHRFRVSVSGIDLEGHDDPPARLS